MTETAVAHDHNKTATKGAGFFRDVWEIAKVLLTSLAIVLPIRYFIAQPFIVSGASMEPNFHDREYLIVDELSYFLRDPERGEPIVFRYPRDPRQFFIKRIIGLPGERIDLKSGNITIYREDAALALHESYLPERLRTYPDMSITLGADEYFVLGDNRNASSDSRVWGTLSEEHIVGRAYLRAWPLMRFGFVPEYDYAD